MAEFIFKDCSEFDPCFYPIGFEFYAISKYCAYKINKNKVYRLYNLDGYKRDIGCLDGKTPREHFDSNYRTSFNIYTNLTNMLADYPDLINISI